MHTCRFIAALAFIVALAPAHAQKPAPAPAQDVISVKQVSPELAREIATRAMEACRAQGYQVSVVVVDRGGAPQAVLRDSFASRFTIEIAERKANSVILSGIESSTFRKNRADIRAELNEIDGILILDGALPIRVGGALAGAVGVSGAPGGDKDEACAAKALSAVQERLEFAE